MLYTEGEQSHNGGTGTRFGRIVLILTGVAALSATLLTVLSVWLQTKNYRKPLLQRYVVRILLMVPIYAIASWASLISLKVAFWVDPFRDVYEAFTIYTFFQLLINFIGGERALIIMMHGRKPVSHLWPLNHCLPKVDISDPHTFLAIKRGILQYTWLKPMLTVATIAMKATGTFQEGYIGLTSGYFWSGLIYNVSITVCLYALALFWVCMTVDLKPFRPMPKFLTIKGVIFASYWQGFFLSILVWLGAIPDDVPGYSPDNLAAAIQDALICFEMPLFAIAHWYAFSWHDYADVTISAARMPVKFALRDAFGPRDLIEDAKDTFTGQHYEYRYFDAYDNVIAHEDSSSRAARMAEGMRFERGGRGKYWIPKSQPEDSRTPLLAKVTRSNARTMSPGGNRTYQGSKYGATEDGEPEEPNLDPDEERLYDNARALEFGDWNYPVIEAHTANREAILHNDPTIITASTNRNLLQPTKMNAQRRKDRIREIQESEALGRHDKGKQRSSSSSASSSASSSGSSPHEESALAKVPVIGKLLRHDSSSSSSSAKSDRSQLVDLVIEDHEAEEIERVRARKEGGAAWNETEPKHFVRAFPEGDEEEEVREGFEPSKSSPKQPHGPEGEHNLDEPFTVGDDETEPGGDNMRGETNEGKDFTKRDYDSDNQENDGKKKSPSYDLNEENPWGS